MSKGVLCSWLYFDRVTQVDYFDPAEFALLVEIDDYVVGFDICSWLSKATVG